MSLEGSNTSEDGGGRYLAFDLGEETFAVEVGRVEVVLEPIPITRVPKAPPQFRGVINYRGSVIPVADLSIRFGREPSSDQKSIIVLRVRYGDQDVTIGVLADRVHEVIAIDPSRIQSPPAAGGADSDALISGIASKGDSFIVLLDIDKAFSEGSAVAEAGAEAS